MHIVLIKGCISLTASPDVARPDKISGADINAICQEVSYVDHKAGQTIVYHHKIFNFAFGRVVIIQI